MTATEDISQAILIANENFGVVVDKDRRYIWKRARNTSQSAFENLSFNEADAAGNSIVKCISTILLFEGKGIHVNESMLTGQSPIGVLENALPEAKVLQLNDLRTDEIVYFIDQSTPIVAYIDEDTAILLTGYSQNRVYYYHPQQNIHSLSAHAQR